MRSVLGVVLLSALLIVPLTPAPAVAAEPSASDQPVASVMPAAATTLRRGDQGPAVRSLQRRLVELRYWLGSVDGVYGYLTEQAVMAFQKVNGLTRDGIAGPQTMAALEHPKRPNPRSTGTRVIEVVKAKQVVLLVRSGVVAKIYNASTGKASTPTPSGSFRVYRQINGWRQSPLGLLYRPKYFTGGYALHGSSSVPAYPASHGCVRVNLRAMDHLWSRVLIGTRVRIY